MALSLDLTVSFVGDGYRVNWVAPTGAEPHQACAVARLVVSACGSAAAGHYNIERVTDMMARVARQNPGFPPAVVTATDNGES